ncbi:MAG: terminase [Sarcina sp.]
MEWWILIPSCGDLKLPIAPTSYEITQGTNNKTVELLNFGEYTLHGMPKAREWTISSFFPAQEYSFCLVKPMDQWDYIKWIKTAKENNDVCKFIITSTDINYWCTIEDFSYGEQDGSGDIYYTIKFREYRV